MAILRGNVRRRNRAGATEQVRMGARGARALGDDVDFRPDGDTTFDVDSWHARLGKNMPACLPRWPAMTSKRRFVTSAPPSPVQRGPLSTHARTGRACPASRHAREHGAARRAARNTPGFSHPGGPTIGKRSLASPACMTHDTHETKSETKRSRSTGYRANKLY